MGVLAWMTQQQQEVTGVVMAVFFVGFGLLMLITGRGPGSELPLGNRKIHVAPQVTRVIGAAGALVGLALGIGSFALSAGQPPDGRPPSDPWGGTAGKLFLAAWVVLISAIAAYNLKQTFKKK